MPATVSPSLAPPASNCSKRRHPDSGTISATTTPYLANKKARTGPAPSSISRSLPMQPHENVLAELEKKYKVLPASVISSSKIEKKVSSILTHLGRFDLADLAQLPGVAMLHARAGDSSKMATVIELVKRRIGETHQPWYQYNRLYEVSSEVDGRSRRRPDETVIEETVLGGGPGKSTGEGEDNGDDDFEVMETPFQRALRAKPIHETNIYMSIFLSRVPIPELHCKSYITTQTNAEEIARFRREQFPVQP